MNKEDVQFISTVKEINGKSIMTIIVSNPYEETKAMLDYICAVIKEVLSNGKEER